MDIKGTDKINPPNFGQYKNNSIKSMGNKEEVLKAESNPLSKRYLFTYGNNFSHNEKILDKNNAIIEDLSNKVKSQSDIRLPIVEDIKHKIKYNGYPIESNIYKAVEKLISNNFIWTKGS